MQQYNCGAEARKAALLRREIRSLERKLEGCYCEFGRSLFESAERHLAAINQLADLLVEKKTALRELEGETLCPNCLMFNPNHNIYCGRCGRPLKQEDTP